MSKTAPDVSPDPVVVERYQQMLSSDPNSKIFAPLADAYRKMGMLKEALATCKEGVRKHPNFPGGRIALARIYIDSDLMESAIHELEKVKVADPENLAALTLLGECYLRLRRLREALAAYKRLLFLSPKNEKAQNAVKKLESLTAADFEDDELFQMRPLSHLESPAEESVELTEPEDAEGQSRHLERILSLADAYLARNESEKANRILNEGERELGSHPEIVKRLKILHDKYLDKLSPPKTSAELQKPASRKATSREAKIETLQNLLVKFQQLQKNADSGLDL